MALVERQNQSRLVFYDIETAFNIGGYFGRTYDTNIAKVIHQGYVLGFAYKFENEKKIHSCYIWDFPRYKKEPRNDIEVVKKWRELMMSTGIVGGHNSDKFDNKVMMGRVLVHRLGAFPMPQTVDTLKMARKIGKFDSNKLDDLGETLGLGRKLHTDVNLWWDCMQGLPKAQKRMVSYNKQDVVLTEKLYRELMPYCETGHPNRANIEGRPAACPKCAKEGFLWAQGTRYTKTGQYRRWQCTACGSYVSSRQQEKTIRPEFV